ncbi:hypothetical protein C5B91_13130 [Haloferax sp. Atlit-10N]|uniref:hypothetical protein n=1 Tax=unclassified Haloferax TaxID=2625095 RepID=UPI000E22F681|nr:MULTISPECIES: hypothetical protein [unclassified Haloferax]RDZ42936.1 hypothetical protein C5B86_14715 [Haloferax sp. Atlit-19N]RDZ43070.1 hypothetical protein C5B87_13960 [Haloferax sp. Atlit-16N]RDZ57645.1 hypothetical protein C5B91_13130 [Haloferax sp. Atlit-10N]
MDPAQVVPSVMFVAAGGYLYRRPMSARSLVSPREWTEAPAKAEVLQRRLGKAVGVALALGGVLWFVVALATG